MSDLLDAALVSRHRTAEKGGQEEERRHTYFCLLNKRFVPGTIIDKRRRPQSLEFPADSVGLLVAALSRPLDDGGRSD